MNTLLSLTEIQYSFLFWQKQGLLPYSIAFVAGENGILSRETLVCKNIIFFKVSMMLSFMVAIFKKENKVTNLLYKL